MPVGEYIYVKQAEFVRNNILTDFGRDHFHIVHIEDMVVCIESRINASSLNAHYEEF